MPLKPTRLRNELPRPAPQQRRRRFSGATPNPQFQNLSSRSASGSKLDLLQILAFTAIGLIGLMLIALIWTMSTRAISEEAMELRARTDQQVRSVAYVLAREIQDELQLVDQSLAIIQDAWNKDAGTVDLGAWRKQSLALTEVANDIFIANEHGIIIQGTVPQSIGQGFGSAYVTYPNGSLETFAPDGTTDPSGRLPGPDGVQARQFLTYIVRPLAKPAGWMIGASYRSEGITKLLSGAKLGQSGVIALVALKRGGLQAIAGPSAQFANMDIAASGLIEQMRKNDVGIWAGVLPIDNISRIFGYQHIPNRDMSVLVGVSRDAANEPLAGLAATARGLAALASLVVLTIAGILLWAMATTRAAARRRQARERSDIELTNTRHELAATRARTLLSEAETRALIGSTTEGVARLDAGLRLRAWNARFAERAGVPLQAGTLAEDLFRRQADLGLFGDPDGCEPAIATRLTLLQALTGSAAPLGQKGENGAPLWLSVRGVTDGGQLLVLTGADTSPLAPRAAADATADQETTDW